VRQADPVPTFRISLDRIPFLASLQQWLIYSKTNGEYEGEDRMKEFKGKVAVITGAAPHGFRNTGLALARSISVITPSGLEDYFIAISKFGPMPPSPADLAKLAGPYGLLYSRQVTRVDRI